MKEIYTSSLTTLNSNASKIKSALEKEGVYKEGLGYEEAIDLYWDKSDRGSDVEKTRTKVQAAISLYKSAIGGTACSQEALKALIQKKYQSWSN